MALTATQVRNLNRMNPSAKQASLGDLLATLETANSENAATRAALIELQTNYNTLLGKLDADGGVSDTDYASGLAVDPLV